jgi:hypothetical protein
MAMLIIQNGLWSPVDGITVNAFLSAPQSNLNFPYDSYGVLHLRNNFKDWKLEHYWRNHTDSTANFSVRDVWK